MKKIKWGVLGAAGIAKTQVIPGMQLADNCELWAIASRTLDKAQEFADKFGFQKAYGSYDELLEDPDVEAIYIPLPNDIHKEWCIRAFEHGKNVLCEKPLAATAADVEEMFAAAHTHGVLFMEAFAYLHSPFTTEIRDTIASGKIGDILYIDSEFVTSFYEPENIRMQKEKFGGGFYDLGCYNTSQILWYTGRVPKEIKASAIFNDDGIDILLAGVMSFEGGPVASFATGMVLDNRGGEFRRIDRFEVHGTKGYIKSNVQFNQSGDLEYILGTDTSVETVTVNARQNYALEVEQFGRCITDGEKPYVSEEFSVRNAKVMDEVLKSVGY